jgi:ribonuclease III
MTGHADEQLEERLNYRFRSGELLEKALTHSSAVSEARAGRVTEKTEGALLEDNERLEFLGDAVLELVTREYLVSRFPHWDEGQLSKSRTRLVNAKSLEGAARRLGIGEHLRLGRGEEKTGGREKQTLLADAFEALLAAIYLDGGLEAARDVLRKVLFEQALEDNSDPMEESDRKSALQELLQGRGLPPALYRLAAESGPDHQKKFQIEVWASGKLLASGEGSTKKEAEQRAARRALERLEGASAKD